MRYKITLIEFLQFINTCFQNFTYLMCSPYVDLVYERKLISNQKFFTCIQYFFIHLKVRLKIKNGLTWKMKLNLVSYRIYAFMYCNKFKIAKSNGKYSELSLKRKTFLFLKKKSQRQSSRFLFEAD